ncbi:YlaI family protein [Pseudalkalibacillus berkeleyi]|uniref:YlaI family protein n=1 Tax=Pseudalkalibacillus berkeleyi TaxID=1069813 RepID=A0ABS9GW85_9BACL|nr:YlaI family protein [Pseudalkalibacillus berkeleyi]MCF6136959.1 YlaI family protein [Pseudalkalibacillus berkeleyi]
MRVKCVLCDKIEKIKDESPLAKKLRNRPIHTYMCEACNSRIKDRTEERKASGNFVTYRDSSIDDTW